MLDAATTAQLKTYLANLRTPVELVATLDDSPKSAEMRTLVETVVEQSHLLSARFDGHADRVPSFAIRRADGTAETHFAGLPLGHEFTSLVLALLHMGGHPPKEEAELLDSVKALEGDFRFETFFSLSCQNCPDVIQAINIMAALNPSVSHVAIDGAMFREEVETRKVMAVPAIYLNGEPFGQGRMDLAQIMAKLDTGTIARAAEKGIRTGVVAERFGGQVLDTMGIENFISIQHTEGPKLAAQLEQHVREYDVDIMNLQAATELIPAAEGGLHEVKLASGATLKARTIILSTGARWRQMGVPGEEEYRNKGVAYCPHCDGPLYKGKRTAVIGGGNSGVEAAIDLAGIVSHVTLVEFDSKLRADAVLQNKLRSLPNVDIITSALSTEVLGDGEKVEALVYTDRLTGESHRIDLEGIFVQIGLVPNTEWLKGPLQLSPRGEIEVDAHNATNIPGVFAAGDVTTVPYKQIIVAMGEGTKAGLSAFDHIIRH
jgi:alkyl hydroperoxide reductase subunit F